MLQRAASNAYSWWWAGHIRTKQSKWLEQSLQDMEEKVEYVLNLIQEDGDSFAKRAEMYYKKRPELIHFVEEFYRAFRALAERFDHLSTELQNANNTLATCFPDQIDLAMDEEDEYGAPRMPPQVLPANSSKVPKAPIRELKRLITAATKQLQRNSKLSRKDDFNKNSSGLSKEEADEEIEKLEKDILALQTVKEFVKSSYQSGLRKYWSIENQIMEKQQRVCKLQDEFDIDKVIEDEDARKLMAEAALKSCQETLAKLQETQEKSKREEREGYHKMEDARQRLKSIRQEFLHDQTDGGKPYEKDDSAKTGDVTPASSQDLGEVIHEKQEMELIQEKNNEQSNASANASITVTELADKIDELVSKVISLETAVSSQTVLIDRLRSESDELHGQIRALEEEKEILTEDNHELRKRVKELEEKLNEIQDLHRNVEKQHSNLQSHFVEAQSSLRYLSGKLSSAKPDEELDTASSAQDQEWSPHDNASQKQQEKQKELPSGANGIVNLSNVGDADGKGEQDINTSANVQVEDQKHSKKTVTWIDPKPLEKAENSSTQSENSVLTIDPKTEIKKENLNWQKMLLSGVEDKEKFLLTEYSTILRSYKDARNKLKNTENRERDCQFEVSIQIRELKSTIAKRDAEIQQLRRKLNTLRGSLGEPKDVEEGNSSAANPSDNIKPEEMTEDEILQDTNTPEDSVITLTLADQHEVSPLEEKIRIDIDDIVDENLDFWLRFSTLYHQVQKFKNTVEDLQGEISKIKEKKKQEESASPDRKSVTTDIKSDIRPIYKHLKEIQTELTVWLEKSESLKDETERRFSSLCNIQEKILQALREDVEDDEMKFSSYQAAKFQGEVLNMKHENTKVKEELQSGIDHITSLQVEVAETLEKLNEKFNLSNDQPQLRRSSSKNQIPLRSFIFGTKPKKKHFFSCIHPNKKYQALRAGLL